MTNNASDNDDYSRFIQYIAQILTLLVLGTVSGWNSSMYIQMIIGLFQVVYYSDKYHDRPEMSASRKMLDLAGIVCRQYRPSKSQIVIDFTSIEKHAPKPTGMKRIFKDNWSFWRNYCHDFKKTQFSIYLVCRNFTKKNFIRRFSSTYW